MRARSRSRRCAAQPLAAHRRKVKATPSISTCTAPAASRQAALSKAGTQKVVRLTVVRSISRSEPGQRQRVAHRAGGIDRAERAIRETERLSKVDAEQRGVIGLPSKEESAPKVRPRRWLRAEERVEVSRGDAAWGSNGIGRNACAARRGWLGTYLKWLSRRQGGFDQLPIQLIVAIR